MALILSILYHVFSNVQDVNSSIAKISIIVVIFLFLLYTTPKDQPPPTAPVNREEQDRQLATVTVISAPIGALFMMAVMYLEIRYGPRNIIRRFTRRRADSISHSPDMET